MDSIHDTPLDSPHTTDLDNMQKFIVRLAVGRLLYVPQWGWMAWDSKRWTRDLSGEHWRLVKLLSNAWMLEAEEASGAGLAERAEQYRAWAIKCRQKNRLEAALKLAETDTRLVRMPAAFDVDTVAFNTESGTLDLASGLLLPHETTDLITKMSGAHYDRAAEAPCWQAFLERILPSAEVRGFVQRAVGYSLSGKTGEQCLFLLHGAGSNGKSTFLRALVDMLGDYASSARPETFMVQDGDAIPNDVAALAGARMIISAETEDGQRFAESRLKQLTGGDMVTARFLQHEFFSFRSTGKIWLACNHKPEIRGVDLGIWRRIRLIEFKQTIPPDEQDRGLSEKLRGEAPGIMAWAVKGYHAWEKMGLRPPQAVVAAGETYRGEQDALAEFLEDCAIVAPQLETVKGQLYGRYVDWSETNKSRPWSSTRLGLRLKERAGIGERREPGTGKRIWTGIGLKA